MLTTAAVELVVLYVLQNFPEQQFELLYNEPCMHEFIEI